jgi:hypothetical protein
VSEYQALPDLDASANAVAITTIKLEFEWFERDSVAKPQCHLADVPGGLEHDDGAAMPQLMG